MIIIKGIVFVAGIYQLINWTVKLFLGFQYLLLKQERADVVDSICKQEFRDAQAKR